MIIVEVNNSESSMIRRESSNKIIILESFNWELRFNFKFSFIINLNDYSLDFSVYSELLVDSVHIIVWLNS